MKRTPKHEPELLRARERKVMRLKVRPNVGPARLMVRDPATGEWTEIDRIGKPRFGKPGDKKDGDA